MSIRVPFDEMKATVKKAFLSIGLTEEERELVLWKNADRLFGLGLEQSRPA